MSEPIDDAAVGHQLQTAGRYAASAAERARALAAEPWTVAVVSRVGAGKSSFLNALTGAELPTGLGGVTRGPTELGHEGTVLIDTPGIDGRDSAINALGPVLADADAILWIVDGLQPATRTERDVIETLRAPGQALAALISRLDLVDPEERPRVRARVQQILDQPDAPDGGDLRAWTSGLPAEISPQQSSWRRAAALRTAFEEALAALDALPPVETRRDIAARLAALWRTEVKGSVAGVVAALETGAVAPDGSDLARLVIEGGAARGRFLAAVATDQAMQGAAAPDLPQPEAPAPSPRERVVAAMGGQARAIAELRMIGARWLGEGLLVLADWVEDAPGLDDSARARADDRQVLTAALATTG